MLMEHRLLLGWFDQRLSLEATKVYFRLRYIISDFEFGDAQISVSDPARQINVLISKCTGDELCTLPMVPTPESVSSDSWTPKTKFSKVC